MIDSWDWLTIGRGGLYCLDLDTPAAQTLAPTDVKKTRHCFRNIFASFLYGRRKWRPIIHVYIPSTGCIRDRQTAFKWFEMHEMPVWNHSSLTRQPPESTSSFPRENSNTEALTQSSRVSSRLPSHLLFLSWSPPGKRDSPVQSHVPEFRPSTMWNTCCQCFSSSHNSSSCLPSLGAGICILPTTCNLTGGSSTRPCRWWGGRATEDVNGSILNPLLKCNVMQFV